MSSDEILTPEGALTLAGEALHGPDHWRMRLSRDMSIDDDTLRRWLRRPGTLRWDHGAIVDLVELLERRASELERVAAQIRAAIKGHA